MFVVRFDLGAFANRKDKAKGFRRSAPFVKVAVVVSFCPNVGRKVVGADGKGPFCREPVTIPPGEFTADKISDPLGFGRITIRP
jgi:hypothetical protein